MSRDFEVTAKEKTLRAAIVAGTALAVPITPAALVGWTTVWIILTVLAAISGGYAALFYGFWLLGVLEGRSSWGSAPELIGDDTCYICALLAQVDRLDNTLRDILDVAYGWTSPHYRDPPEAFGAIAKLAEDQLPRG